MLKRYFESSPRNEDNRTIGVAGISRRCGFVAKRIASKLAADGGLSPLRRLEVCLNLLHTYNIGDALQPLARALEPLSQDERHYWIGTFYTLLIGIEQRRQQSAYFTPPEIAHHLLRLAFAEGVDLKTARILDPAAGGAAFLSMVAGRMRDAGCSPGDVLRRLRGVEIDPMLAELARQLIADRLGVRSVPEHVIKVRDALAEQLNQKFDLVLANPPYGRVFPAELASDRWQRVCHPGHINKYALFVDLCLSKAKPGGIVALVVPSSFIAGPLYGRLRVAMRHQSLVKVLGRVECREEFFFDVRQDTSLLILQRRREQPNVRQGPVSFGRIERTGKWTISTALSLPASPSDGWLLPGTARSCKGGATLADYGCTVKTGYFVWNREQHRMVIRASRRAVPLFWACNIRANISAKAKAKRRPGTDYVTFDAESPAIIRGPSVLLQRTTNSKQPRRLIAARVDTEPYLTKGYVTENHTIVVVPTEPHADIDLVCRLLNTAAVDQRYRRLSGTASISSVLLRDLDLPQPTNLQKAMERHKDVEAAVEAAYALGSLTRRAAS